MPKRKLRNKKSSRRSTISDVPKTGTNIRVKFKNVWYWQFTNHGLTKALKPQLADLTAELGLVYKLYRCTHCKLTFQANRQPINGVVTPVEFAIAYVPAANEVPSIPSALDKFEGPAVTMYAANRGAPLHWTVPSTVLNAMPYNWYETASNAATFENTIQGYFVARCDNASTFAIHVLAEWTFEFQTLEDPALLTSRVRQQVVAEMKRGFEKEDKDLSRSRDSRMRSELKE